MHLDLPTLLLMSVAITVVIGLLFLLSWTQSRGTHALAYWGLAHLIGGVAAALLCLRGLVPDILSIDVGNALMLGAYGLTWSGLRSFGGQAPAHRVALAGGLVWCLACLVPAFYSSVEARVTLASTMAGLYCALGAWACWKGRAEQLASRRAVIVLMSAYAALYWVRIPLVLLAPLPLRERPLETPWLAALCFTSVLMTVAIAFMLMALTKERAEREQRRAAETDALTGLANRRAFVAAAERGCADAAPFALLVLDLDHFKVINDSYGHEAGDRVLVAFARAAEAALPGAALLGRLGGEEFACLVPGDAREALAIAERLRAATAAISIRGCPGLTVRASIGLSVKGLGAAARFATLMREADHALYAAKRMGRDRVVPAPAAAAAMKAMPVLSARRHAA